MGKQPRLIILGRVTSGDAGRLPIADCQLKISDWQLIAQVPGQVLFLTATVSPLPDCEVSLIVQFLPGCELNRQLAIGNLKASSYLSAWPGEQLLRPA